MVSPQDRGGDPLDAGIPFGRYLIHELIGVGGMAEVYRASSQGPSGFEKPVVIKRVKPMHAQDEAFVQMFIDEAKLSATLNHPHIVSVFDFGEEEGNNFLAMEYIDGLHLQAVHVRYTQKHRKPLPWAAVVLIGRDVLRGLDYAHHSVGEDGQPLGLIHRDVNLVNIMLRRDGMIKLLDFGIVKAAEGIRSAETMSGVLKGKIGYMSPEQAAGKPLDARSDVFSTSIVLHELLTGRRLFYGEDDLTVLHRVQDGSIPDPRRFAPDIPQPVVDIIMKGLARDLGERHESAAAMAEALEGVVFEHRIAGSLLRELMLDLMGEAGGGPRVDRPERIRERTIHAWQEGAGSDVFAPTPIAPPRVASGQVGDTADAAVGEAPTAVGKRPLEASTQITTDPRWMLPDMPAVALPVPDLADVIGPGSGRRRAPRLGRAGPDEKTEILAGEEPSAALTDQETVILSQREEPEPEAPTAAPTAPPEPPAEAAAPTAGASPRPKTPLWVILVTVLGVVAVAVIVAIFVLSS